MQIQNDYEKDAFNGDIGFVAAIDTDEAEVLIDFDGRQIVYEFGELDEVVLAYANTIHKSQGSEYPAVVIPVLTQHYPMLHRNLLYTGITRGARLVVLIGQKKAVGIAVRGPALQKLAIARLFVACGIDEGAKAVHQVVGGAGHGGIPWGQRRLYINNLPAGGGNGPGIYFNDPLEG